MRVITQEWVEKAERDWNSLERELRLRRDPNYDDACFHAQQCAEKYLKARLQESSVHFPKTHGLLSLLALTLPIEAGWTFLHAPLDALSDYAVKFRYPGLTADRDEAKEARRHCATVRTAARLSLGLTL